MACGCFPIAGDIPSIRDWIQHGINGLLMDPKKPEAIANEILSALSSPHLITNASKINYELVQNQASLEVNLPKIKKLYFELLNKRG
jgi:glycosyltransferase involved in cell wall biosynthesis